MRILVTGVKGQLGHDVVNEMVKRGLEPVGVDLEEMDRGLPEGDHGIEGGRCDPLRRLYGCGCGRG